MSIVPNYSHREVIEMLQVNIHKLAEQMQQFFKIF